MTKCPYSFPARSRKAMLAYLGAHSSYWPMSSWNRGFVLAWNVKIYKLDSSGKAAPLDYPVQDRFDAQWEAYAENDSHLFWEACENAARLYTDGEWSNYPGIEQGEWQFGINGRSGGYMILSDAPAWLTKPRGWACNRMTWDSRGDYQEWLAELPTDQLRRFYRAIVALDRDLRREACESEVAYHIAFRRHEWESDLIAAETCSARRQEAERPDLYDSIARNA